VPPILGPTPAFPQGPTAALDRHQASRESGLPTVSVLSGPIGLALREARLWAGRSGRPIVEVDDDRIEAIVEAWSARLAGGGELSRLVLARLAGRLGDDPEALRGRVDRMSPPELALFLDAVPSDPKGRGVEEACRWALQGSRGGREVAGPGLADRLGEALAGGPGGGPTGRALAALGALAAIDQGPAILAARGPGRVDAAAGSLGRLALAEPRLAAILAVEPGPLETYLKSAPESREKALIRSGVVPISALDGEAIGRRLAEAAPGRAGAIRRLADDGASDGLVDLFLDAARAGPATDGPTADRARSAAERFLFERLETLPATSGLFELNATLDIPFGPGRKMEVDLASRTLRLAIEVDGYYHFQGEDAYRRDRRKDVLLQERGYLVVRVLAEDVVPRLEAVLDLILGAVDSRRRAPIHPDRDARP